MVATEKSHKFEKGNTYGRETSRKGVPNKTTRILKDAVLLAAEQVGDISGIAREDLAEEGIEHGKDGLVGTCAGPQNASRKLSCTTVIQKLSSPI